jgi:hypothetical protein
MTIMAPRYVVKKGFLGNGFMASDLLDLVGGIFAFFGEGGDGRRYIIPTGARRRALRRRGVAA